MDAGLTHLTSLILLSLADGPLHGYGVLQSIEDHREGARGPRAASLYAALHRLTRDGLIEEAEVDDGASGGPQRTYYRITEAGADAMRAETERLQRLLRLARQKKLAAGLPWTARPRTEP